MQLDKIGNYNLNSIVITDYINLPCFSRVDPNSRAGPGIDDADFVFYVSARQTERCHKGLTVAYAGT